jgi:SAM-dependent methyltransferase
VSAKTDLYNTAYANYGASVYRDVRIATYGQDFGQTSWVTNLESEEIPGLLNLTSSSHVLELGCGSGRYALHLAEKLKCRVTAVDLNPAAIENATRLLTDNPCLQPVRFQRCDLARPLPFDDQMFDAVFANDVMCHVPGRSSVLGEIFRILRCGGRFLFSDALVIGGEISHEEIATRSAIGFYVFSPPGKNEFLIHSAGFRLIESRDTTHCAAQISSKWHHARENRKNELIALEGEMNFSGLQRFLTCVANLTSERRLLRFLYLAEKPVVAGQC